MALSLLGLTPPAAEIKGRILYMDKWDLTKIPEYQFKNLRGDGLVLVPQNPLSHLNPTMRIKNQIKEAFNRHGLRCRKTIKHETSTLLSTVGFPDPGRIANSFPHQLSGGMAQRVLLAIGLIGSPKLVVADEPTRGLDAEARDRYIELVCRLYKNSGVLIITHDMETAAICDRVMVMYAGSIVENGPRDQVLQNPRHPYTIGLLNAHPDFGLHPIPGEPFSFRKIPGGCAFHPRCDRKTPRCLTVHPQPSMINNVKVSCFHA